MTTLELVTNDQSLIAVVTPKLASGDVNSVKLNVDFDSAWDGFHARSAIFYTSNDETKHEALLTEGECTVPGEVLADVGILFIGVRGITTDGEAVKTSSIVKYKIVQGATASERTLYPTLDMYQQYLAAMNEKMTPLIEEYKAMLANYATLVYVDTKLASLVDSAPETLDTLQELSKALGDDPNFATTISNLIGSTKTELNGTISANKTDADSKIAAANTRIDTTNAEVAKKVNKAGDTMTGFLTLHANPTAALHAATKQYADGLISSFPKMKFASYTGGGVYGSGKPTTVSLPFAASVLIVFAGYNNIVVFRKGDTYTDVQTNSNEFYSNYVAFNGNTVAWEVNGNCGWKYVYSSTEGIYKVEDSELPLSVNSQLNKSNTTYYYLALGE